MDKILAGYINDFAVQHGFEAQPEAEQFHHFVNYCLVSRATSDSFDIEDLSTDGGGDTGIDGSAVLVNGHVVSSTDDIDYFRDRGDRLDVQFILIQSKSSPHFNAAEMGSFFFGVQDTFSDMPKAPGPAPEMSTA